MADSRFKRLQKLFNAAVELDIAAQDVFVARACVDDEALSNELRQLLSCDRVRCALTVQPAAAALDAVLRHVLPSAFIEGSRIGPFRIEAQIGNGGMGRVYRAVYEDGDNAREVAIKLVRSELLSSAMIDHFYTECRVLAALDHPNLCRFIDAGALSDGTPFFTMELVRGEPLFEYCDARRLGLRERLRLLRKIVVAAGHAHSRLIVHRDIKSSNVLVDEYGEPKLLDFGIAKLLGDNGRELSATCERFFTPAYAAPEQLRGVPIGIACDIYAIGLLAYGLLCGCLPYDLDGLSDWEVKHLLLEVPAPLMSRRASDVAAAARSLPDAHALSRALCGDLVRSSLPACARQLRNALAVPNSSMPS